MTSILIPVDLSDCSLSNCIFGARIAINLKAELHIIHCYNQIKINDIVDEDTEASKIIPHSVSEQEATEKLIAMQRAVLEIADSIPEYSQTVKYKLIKSPPAQGILDYSTLINPDLIIINSKAKGDMVKKTLGSLSTYIINSINIPVLVIPENKTPDLNTKISLCFICNYSDCDKIKIHNILKMFSVMDLNLTILHLGDIKTDSNKILKLNELLSTIEDNDKRKISFEFIETEDYLEGLEEYMKIKNPDIISFSIKKKSFFTSLLFHGLPKILLFKNDVPLLVFNT